MRAVLALLVITLSASACAPGGGKASPTPAKTPAPPPEKQTTIPQPIRDPAISLALRTVFPHDPDTNVFVEVTPRDPKMPAAGFLLSFDGGVERVTALLQAPLDPSLVVLLIPDVSDDPNQMLNLWSGAADLNAALCVMPLQSGVGRTPREWTLEEREARFVESVADVRRLMNGFEQVEQLKGRPIILIGEGRGAEVALMATAADDRVDALALREMTGGPGDTYTQGEHAAGSILYAEPVLQDTYQPSKLGPFVAPRPLLIQNPRQDPTLHITRFTALYDSFAEPKTQRWYEGVILMENSIADAYTWLRATIPPPAVP